MKCACKSESTEPDGRCSCKRKRKYVEPHPCLNCGDETTNIYFCSNLCHNAVGGISVYRDIEAWIAGEIGMSKPDGSLRTAAKSYLLREADHKCTLCGWGKINPKLGKPILCIDHIDGNWQNNFRKNLIVLCYNCHSLTPTFAALNRGTVSPRSVYSRKKWDE